MDKDFMSPKVSVLISTKNRPTLVQRAVDSILSQSFISFELIIVDVSTDDQTRDVISAYSDPRIHYKQICNEISAAKTVNNALFEARGEYLALCDDDDEWSSPDKLAKQMALIESLGEGYGFVSCGCELWDDSKNKPIGILYPQAKGIIFPEMLKKNVASGTPTQLIRKSAFLSVGGYDEECEYSADYLLYTKLSKLFMFDYVPEILVRSHLHHKFGSQQNLINSKFTYYDKIEYYDRFLKIFEEDYKLYPKAKGGMVESIITLTAKAGGARLFFRYMSIYIRGSFSLLFVLKRSYRLIIVVLSQRAKECVRRFVKCTKQISRPFQVQGDVKK